ncbi:glycosyltransferase family 4 protein [Patescibacteria group bacterium]|nr:glycosyltransferase family 4 protein [Patescibacteria group bacterium]
MKIGIDASRANREFKTGTEWYSYYLIKNLIEIDKENKYVLYSDKVLSENFLQDLNLKDNKHVKVKILRWPFKFFWTLGRLSLEMIFSRPDILFVPAHVMPLFFPRKSITTIHDVAFVGNECLYEKEVVDFESNLLKKIVKFFISILTRGKCELRASDYLNWSTRFALKRVKKVISVSNFTKKEILSNYKINPDKIAVVYNGFNSDLYKKIEDKNILSRTLFDYGLDNPYFLYVGRIEKKKNISLLISAFNLYKENNKESREKLVLVGNIGFGYDEIKYMISEFDLFRDIIMLGWVEEKDMPYIFNGSKAFVFPSLHEGFGIPILQAMACGVPIIASDIDVLREVGGDSPLFFNSKDENDLCSKMELLVDDEKKVAEMIESGFLRAKNFSWKKCAEETLKEIKSL